MSTRKEYFGFLLVSEPQIGLTNHCEVLTVKAGFNWKRFDIKIDIKYTDCFSFQFLGRIQDFRQVCPRKCESVRAPCDFFQIGGLSEGRESRVEM